MDISKLFICFTVQSLTVICQSEVCFWPCLLVLCASWYFRVPFIHIRKFSVIWGLLIRFTFPYLQESYDMYVWSLDHVSQIWSIRVFPFFSFFFQASACTSKHLSFTSNIYSYVSQACWSCPLHFPFGILIIHFHFFCDTLFSTMYSFFMWLCIVQSCLCCIRKDSSYWLHCWFLICWVLLYDLSYGLS